MNIVFAGSPEIAVPSLLEIARQYSVVGVLTNPDTQSGRGKKVTSTPVKQKACELGLSVITPAALGSETRETVRTMKPDILVVVAYKKIFGPKFLSLFPLGAINMHPSLLPLYRGPSPINYAILNGDTKTGITIQRIALEMDAGDILYQETVKIDEGETTLSLTEKCGRKGSQAIVSVLKDIEAGTVTEIPQDHKAATYTSIIHKEDGLINWEEQTDVILRKIRGYYPWPLAFTFLGQARLNILAAERYPEEYDKNPGYVIGLDKKKGILIQTGDGVIAVRELQLQSKKVMDFRSFINGTNMIAMQLGGYDGAV